MIFLNNIFSVKLYKLDCCYYYCITKCAGGDVVQSQS